MCELWLFCFLTWPGLWQWHRLVQQIHSLQFAGTHWQAAGNVPACLQHTAGRNSRALPASHVQG